MAYGQHVPSCDQQNVGVAILEKNNNNLTDKNKI